MSSEYVKALCSVDDTDFPAPRPPNIPQPPTLSNGVSLKKRVERIQAYLRDFRYNHIGREYWSIDKNKSLGRTLDCAKLIIRESLPIKCLEAVGIATHLTQIACFDDVQRIPLRFRFRFPLIYAAPLVDAPVLSSSVAFFIGQGSTVTNIGILFCFFITK